VKLGVITSAANSARIQENFSASPEQMKHWSFAFDPSQCFERLQ